MKRNTGLLLLVIMTLFVGLLVIPITHADNKEALNGKRIDQASNVPAAKSPLGSSFNQSKQDRPGPKAAGEPNVMNAASSLSAAILTTAGGRGTQFSEVSLLADWDGREDYVADRAQKIDDFSFTETEIDTALTRTGISEHTVANGFLENVYYYGDSNGNFWVGTDLNPGINATSVASIDTLRQVNIPTLINTLTSGGFTLKNPQAGDCADGQVVVTGIAVSPVVDLGDFDAALCGTIGEVVYVSIEDTSGCSANAANQPFRTRILAFAFTDVAGGVAPALPTGAIQILRNPLGNSAGVAVDDDGNIYFQLADKLNRTGAAIFKVSEGPRTVAGCAVNPRTNRVVTSIPSGLSGGIGLNTAQGTAAAPILIAAGYRLTNYSGPATTFGNIAAIASGPGNVLYAAVARSFVAADDPGTQNTEGAFTNPAALGATPSMIISFSDTFGLTDVCSSPTAGVQGEIKVADGISDQAKSGQTRIAGVNNFRVFALGSGPSIGDSAGTAIDLLPTTLKLDMQIDPTVFSGLAVDEAGTVFVVSGGTPAGVGLNPSPRVGEILAFQDSCPADRRGDFLDFRGNASPNPPASGGNVGDGDSDRFDHIYWQAPVDPVNNLPTGVAGLARGFLRYTNRLAPTEISPGVLLGKTGGTTVLGDDATSGEIIFENLDPGHQVAGGDDQNTPFRGDDNDGSGNTLLAAALLGGFEFSFGGPVGVASCTWNSFYLNSNGNISFGSGDTDNTPTVVEFRSGLPKIAPAWADINPSARAVNPINFPVQALGFSGPNKFKVRWINATEFGSEDCVQGPTNTFAVTLSDDGVGTDENANQPLNPANPIGNNAVPFDLQEGPTDLQFVRDSDILIGQNPRAQGTGNFVTQFARMDLLGTEAKPVLSGFSIGGLAPTNPPGLCPSNLGTASQASESGTFGAIQGQTASIQECLIGEGTEPTIFEFFNTGNEAMVSMGGDITLATPSFDLRFEGNDPALSTPSRQTDLNKGQIGYYGVSCAPPPNPLVFVVLPRPFVATPTSTDLIDVIRTADVDIFGTGFFPNEVTIVCQGDPGGGIPTQRPGKTVSTAAILAIDTDGNGIAEATLAMSNVTVFSRNHVRATLTPLMTAPGTPFPFAAGGGFATATVTTTFTSGDNNIFGPFTRTSVGTLFTGLRAPVVLSVTATEGDCGVSQDLLITGSSFQYTAVVQGMPSTVNAVVTRVFAVDTSNPSNVIDATSFAVLDNNLLTARFDFGAANAGRSFLIFVTGTGGTSRNLTELPAGAPPGSPLGNEQGNLVTFSCQVPPPVIPDTFQFSTSNVNQTEDCTVTNVTVSRLNPTAGSATVDYSTNDVSATQRSDYEIASGTLTFAPGETSKTIPILINEDSLVEGNETLSILLTNPSGAISGGLSTVTIVDDDLVPGANPIDDPGNFVCQQYHDFLNRQPDPAGLAFWTNEIVSCGADAACIDMKRQNVSAAFFLSIEFQETGGDVIRTQRVAFGRKSDNALLRYPYQSFMHDAQQVGRGVVIGDPGANALLEANKQTYATQIATSTDFITRFPLAQTAAQYVAALFASAMVSPTAGETSAAITAFGAGGTAGRVAALRSVADADSVRAAERNGAFVLLEYYGYLRRNPTDPPDGNDVGYQFWLGKLNSFGGDAIQAQMVKAFLDSMEYRQRFGP